MTDSLSITGTEGAPPPAPASSTGTIAPPTTGAPALSPTDVMAAREAWLAAGLPAEQFDAAAKRDGYSVETPAQDVVEHHAAFDLPIAPSPSDYSPRYAAP